MSRLDLAGVVGDSITDGPGLRTAIFVQGCPHHCAGCHNPETHAFGAGTPTDTDALFERVAANPLLSGVTFSGGEPMCQAAALAALGKRVKQAGLELACYTGYTLEALLAEADPDRMALLAVCDVLIDGPFVLAQRSLELKFKGSRNQRTLDVQKSLAAGAPVLCADPRWV
ncbi:MAG: anaerobic ribonucleoside-triphosphate reductase activating protein [Oscillospiraceae bacterium]|nr:anaerobic ribonucleoside-triphosphate reductase activating protein [Oscillospiraceae bacterium]